MKDALSAGEYTVTLTPADEDEDPSSVTFEAVTANKATRIEILGDYLVMKDTNFDEGYCFIKGYNEFDEEITLSGLTVNAAPSSSTQYDSSTGKLTVKSDTANQYAIIKQVTVYAQAMVDSKAIVAQKTLEVSSIGYPAEVEFGEITKDATTVPDISDGITINEINSGLYYIPIVSVKDNYGNEMLAKDLNDLDVANLLTTVPTSDKSLYFSVRTEGSVFTEKNGKVVVFLGEGNHKPGKFNFLMTSAGGQFEKEVNIIENPFIDTLDVTLPDIYEYEETEEFGLVGHDQDGNELDLYDYLQAGEFDNKLTFIDQQNLTESKTTIDAGTGNGKWRVQKFADTKTYKVTFVPSNQVKAKGIITFVTTTASFHTDTQMATVGSRGTSGNISAELKSAAKASFDFNKNLQFLDANGKKMDRAHNPQYPTFVTAGDSVIASLDKAVTVNLTDEKIAQANHNDTAADDFDFFYVVSTADKTVVSGVSETVTQNTGTYQDGVAPAEGQYYVFLIASQDITNPAKTRIIDSRTFYVSNSQTGDVPVSYSAKVDNKLYTGDKYDDDVTVTVTVTYRNGVTKDYAATGLALDSGFVAGSTTISKGTIKGDGSTTVSVYLASVAGLDEDGKAKTYYNDGAVATCTLTYSDDDPVGTSVDFKREVQLSNYGTSWTEGETETVWDLDGASVITVEDGELTMYNGNVAGDTYTMKVEDQYGTVMEDAKYYINGTQVPTTLTEFANATTAKVLEIKGQSKGSEVSKTWRVNVPKNISVTAQDTSVVKVGKSVTTKAQLTAALAADDINEIYVNGDVDLGGFTLTKDVFYYGDGDKTTVPAQTGTITLDGGDLVFKAPETVTLAAAATMNDGDIYILNGAKLTLVADQELKDNDIIVQNGILSTNSDITSTKVGTTVLGTGAVILKDDAELDVTADKAITNLTITEDATKTSPAIVDATGQVLTVTNIDIDGHGVLAAGTIKAAATGATIDISGKSLDLAAGTVLDLTNLATPTYTSINLGSNKGTVKVGDKAGLVSLLNNSMTNGTISIKAAITLDSAQTITSTKAIVIDETNDGITGTIVNGTNGDLTVSGTNGTNLVIENSGDLTVSGTVKEVDNKSTGELTVDGTVTTLKAEAGSETTVANGGTVTALTGTTGGTLNAEAGASIAGVATTAPGTVENITASTTGTDVNTSAATEAKTLLDALSITNPTTLTAAEYKNASTDDTDTTNVQKDLLAVVKALVIEGLGTDYDSEKDNLNVSVAWTNGTVTNPIAAANTGKYKVTVELNGATKTDKEDTTLTFTNLPTGPKTAAKAVTLTCPNAFGAAGTAAASLTSGYTYKYTLAKTSADVDNSQTASIDVSTGAITLTVGTDATANDVTYSLVVTATATNNSEITGTASYILHVVDTAENAIDNTANTGTRLVLPA